MIYTRVLLLCVALFIAWFDGLSQSYKPMLEGYKQWSIMSCNGPHCFIDSYWLGGDTILRNKEYRLLDGYHFGNTVALREDKTTRKVYSQLIGISPILEPEELLYDFSLSVGDSLFINNPQSPVQQNPGFYSLDSVAPISYLGQVRNTYYLSSNSDTNKAVWVEGIGSLTIINVLSQMPDHNTLAATTCVNLNGKLIYRFKPNDREDSCANFYVEPSVGIEHYENKKENINLYPNPISRFMTIESDYSVHRIEIYNSVGELMLKKDLLKNPLRKVLMDLAVLEEGIYHIRIFDDNQISNNKIVMQN